MLSVLTTHIKRIIRQEKALGGNGYVYDFDGDHGFMNIYLSSNSYALNMYHFLHVNHSFLKWVSNSL